VVVVTVVVVVGLREVVRRAVVLRRVVVTLRVETIQADLGFGTLPGLRVKTSTVCLFVVV
jgi:hypothetical protein